MGAEYQFFTQWRVAGTLDEVKDVLGDARTLPQWWPAVYLSVHVVEPGGAGGEGAVVDLYTKGWFPYTLRWTLSIIEPITDAGFALRATGDLDGTGRWTFAQDGPEVAITYRWHISATKPLLRRLSWLFKPAFAANHRWAMKKGLESLQLELRRRRATGDEAATIPPPPPATFRWLKRGRK